MQLAQIIPAGSRLEARLFAKSRNVGFVKPGMTVWLRYDAFPYQKFGQFKGTITEVSISAFHPAAAPQSAGAEPTYQIVVIPEAESVRLDGHDLRLRPGMQVEGSVEVERRRLAEWLFAPLLAWASL
jgi:membrane fusion protein